LLGHMSYCVVKDSTFRLLIVPLFRGSSRFESWIASHHSKFNVACECNEEESNDDDEYWKLLVTEFDEGGGRLSGDRRWSTSTIPLRISSRTALAKSNFNLNLVRLT